MERYTIFEKQNTYNHPEESISEKNEKTPETSKHKAALRTLGKFTLGAALLLGGGLSVKVEAASGQKSKVEKAAESYPTQKLDKQKFNELVEQGMTGTTFVCKDESLQTCVEVPGMLDKAYPTTYAKMTRIAKAMQWDRVTIGYLHAPDTDQTKAQFGDRKVFAVSAPTSIDMLFAQGVRSKFAKDKIETTFASLDSSGVWSFSIDGVDARAVGDEFTTYESQIESVFAKATPKQQYEVKRFLGEHTDKPLELFRKLESLQEANPLAGELLTLLLQEVLMMQDFNESVGDLDELSPTTLDELGTNLTPFIAALKSKGVTLKYTPFH